MGRYSTFDEIGGVMKFIWTQIVIIASLLILLFSFSNAHAQSSVQSSSVPMGAPTSSVPSSTTTLAPAPGAGTSPWGFSYYNLGTSTSDLVNYGGASWNVYQYFQLIYKMNSTEKFTFRTPFSTTTAGYGPGGQTQAMATASSDIAGTYANSSFTKLNDWNLSGTLYAYLPTSSSSLEKRWITRFSSWMILDRPVGTTQKIAYHFKPDYYVQTQKAYRTETARPGPDGSLSTSAVAQNNSIGKVDHYFEYTYFLNDTINPFVDVGVIHEWFYPSDQAASSPSLVENFKFAPGTFVNVNPQLRFLFSAENRVNLQDRKSGDAQLFREKETVYTFMTFWTIL